MIDSGIDNVGSLHPEFACANKLAPGYDFAFDDSNPNDGNGHGTHVAGIVGACTNNALGVAGTSWGARIMPLRTVDASGSGFSSDTMDAIRYAADNGARIINLSLGVGAHRRRVDRRLPERRRLCVERRAADRGGGRQLL